MPLYDTIAPYYDALFPIGKDQTELVRRILPPACIARRVLDMGCGTGSLLASLPDEGLDLVGIDDNPAMISEAVRRHGNRPGLVFRRMDMRDIVSEFSPRSFHAVISLGNTLVHLPGPSEIASFIKQVRTISVESGVFLLQILNYDYILKYEIKKLPRIESGEFLFVRSYEFEPGARGPIRFITKFTIKSTGQTVADTTRLYPLRSSEIDEILRAAGFSAIDCFGSFDRSPLKDDSLPLIIEAR